MAYRNDDDDWTGTPPEGRHAPERARPDYWRTQRPPLIAAVGITVVVVLLVAALLLG